MQEAANRTFDFSKETINKINATQRFNKKFKNIYNLQLITNTLLVRNDVTIPPEYPHSLLVHIPQQLHRGQVVVDACTPQPPKVEGDPSGSIAPSQGLHLGSIWWWLYICKILRKWVQKEDNREHRHMRKDFENCLPNRRKGTHRMRFSTHKSESFSMPWLKRMPSTLLTACSSFIKYRWYSFFQGMNYVVEKKKKWNNIQAMILKKTGPQQRKPSTKCKYSSQSKAGLAFPCLKHQVSSTSKLQKPYWP